MAASHARIYTTHICLDRCIEEPLLTWSVWSFHVRHIVRVTYRARSCRRRADYTPPRGDAERRFDVSKEQQLPVKDLLLVAGLEASAFSLREFADE